MPITPRGIWTPGDSDEWDLTTDLATTAVSIDSALDSIVAGIPPQTYRTGTNANRLALSGGSLFNGLLFWTTDTRILWQFGTSWSILFRPLASYSPTISGLNLAQVTVDAKYEQRGKMIRGEILITRTVAGSPTATVSVSLPEPAADASMIRALGGGSFYLQNNTTAYITSTRFAGGTSVSPNVSALAGSALAQGTNVNPTFPTSAAHGVGTTIYIPFDYEAA